MHFRLLPRLADAQSRDLVQEEAGKQKAAEKAKSQNTSKSTAAVVSTVDTRKNVEVKNNVRVDQGHQGLVVRTISALFGYRHENYTLK